MLISFKSVFLAIFASCVSFAALADSQWYAKPDGADDADCTSPATAGSFAAAMAKAAAADGASVIELAGGDYDIGKLTPVTENGSMAFFVVKKDLTLVSAGGDPANCCLVGGGEEKRARFLLIPSAASVALSGITVTGFWDSADDANYKGGGAIFANGTSVTLTISDCVFSYNHTRRSVWASGINGGAINGGTLDITDTSFIGNLSITGSWESGGGGAFCGKVVRLKDCLFQGNDASANGGAIYLSAGMESPIEGCTFVGNGYGPNVPSRDQRTYFGVIYASGAFTLKNCTFRSNKMNAWMGSVFGASGSNAIDCQDCTFEDNAAMYVFKPGYGSGSLRRCRMLNNVFQSFNAALAENCLFKGQSFTERQHYFGTGPYHNCTFVGNTALNVSGANGGVFSNGAKLINCIVTADNQVNATAASYTYYATNCIWNASGKDLLVGKGNITDLADDAAIKFVVLGDDPYALMLDSPARDQGDNVLGYTAADRDLAGGSRLVRALDIGAYEYQIAAFEADIEPQVFDGVNGCEPHPVVTDAETETVLAEGTDYTLSWSNNEQTGMGTMRVTGVNGYAGKTANIDFKIVSQYGDGLTFYAKVGGSDDADCVNWATAGSFAAAMAKVAAAQGPCVVVLDDGDYDIAALEPVTENNSTSFFIAKKDLTLVSAGGDPANCALIGGGKEKRARFLCVPVAATVAIKGLTVTNFCDSASDTGSYAGGGAIFANGTSVALTVTNCVFADNHVLRTGWVDIGGGGAIRGGALDVTDSSFVGNSAMFDGTDEKGTGGALSAGSYVRISGCIFTGNTASSVGEVIYATSGISAPIEDCTFIGNGRNRQSGVPPYRAIMRVGLIYVSGGGFTLKNCVIRDNNQHAWGGSLFHATTASHCYDCLFEGNTAMYVAFVNGNTRTDLSLHRCRMVNNVIQAFNTGLNENCLFKGHTFTERQHYFGANSYYNCTFVGNTSLNVSGVNGGVFSNGAKLINCIVTADNQVNPTAASYTYYATNCVWNASGKDLLVGENNITDLANDAAIGFVGGTGDDPYAIQKNSPARDKGANVLGYTKKDHDLAGNPRLSFDGLLDIGCYEYLKTPGLMLLLR